MLTELPNSSGASVIVGNLHSSLKWYHGRMHVKIFEDSEIHMTKKYFVIMYLSLVKFLSGRQR